MKNKNFFKISLIYYTAMILIAVIFALGALGLLENSYLSSFLIQIVVMFGIPMLMYSLMISKNAKQTLKDVGFKKISGKIIGYSFLLGLILYCLNSFIATYFYSILTLFGYENLAFTIDETNFTYSMFFKELILSCAMPAFFEEFLHRGIMFNAAKKHANPKYCLIISSLLFGLIHMNIYQFLYASILGFLMGYVAMVSDSIYPTIIIHFCNNFLSTYFSYGASQNWPLANYITQIRTVIYSSVFSFVLISSGLIALLFFAYKKICKIIEKEQAKQDINNLIIDLNLRNLPIEVAQERVSLINKIIEKVENQKPEPLKNSKTKTAFLDNIFIICSFVLGALVVFSSFIWGII